MSGGAVSLPSVLTVGFGVLLFTTILIIAIVDYRRLVLPDRLNLLLAIGGVGQALLLGRPDLVDAIAGGLVGFMMLCIVAMLFRWARGMEGLGFGDQKFVAAAGLWLGWERVAPMLLIASIAALAFAVIRSAWTGAFGRNHRLPFGPFLGLGTAA